MKVRRVSATASANARGRGSPNVFLRALPNVVTIGALVSGLTAILFAIEGQFSQAVGCIVLAAALDGCDGRLARLAGTSSPFGAELDSLSDVISFGAAPALLASLWGLENFGITGWAACMAFAAATALRLARFNVAAQVTDKPVWAVAFFQGVPSPAGAFLGLLPLYMQSAGWLTPEAARWFALVWMPVVAALMVSNLPTFSGKHMGRMMTRAWLFASAVACVVVAVVVGLGVWSALVVVALLYIASLPLGLWRHNHLVNRQP